MNVNPIGNGNYYIEIRADELCGAEVRDVIREGVPELPGDTVFEVFDGADGALVFARARCGAVDFGERVVRCGPVAQRFASLEEVIAAALDDETAVLSHDGEEAVSFLVKVDGAYCVLRYDWGETAAAQGLGAYALHVAEHGEVLLGPHALRELRGAFGG